MAGVMLNLPHLKRSIETLEGGKKTSDSYNEKMQYIGCVLS